MLEVSAMEDSPMNDGVKLAQVFRPIPIDGVDGYYVGDQGSVASGRSINGRNSHIFETRQMLRYLKPGNSQWGHKVVSLQVYLPDGCRTQKTFKVHRLVLMAFRGSCPPG